MKPFHQSENFNGEDLVNWITDNIKNANSSNTTFINASMASMESNAFKHHILMLFDPGSYHIEKIEIE
jgi:hypothetical protein